MNRIKMILGRLRPGDLYPVKSLHWKITEMIEEIKENS